MKKPESFFVISQFNNNLDWVKEFTDDYIIYDKSNTLPEGPKVIKLEDVGYNIYDYGKFIVDNYDNLPEVMALLEGNPFDHCKYETFCKLIYNTEFTSLEDYSHVPESYAHKKTPEGLYSEINTSWYLYLTEPRFQHKYYDSFDSFMDNTFSNYEHLDWISFAPGAQYIVPKKNVLKYSKQFYQEIMNIVGYCTYPMEGHMVERALGLIFSNKYDERI